jgi:hypothetical protein
MSYIEMDHDNEAGGATSLSTMGQSATLTLSGTPASGEDAVLEVSANGSGGRAVKADGYIGVDAMGSGQSYSIGVSGVSAPDATSGVGVFGQVLSLTGSTVGLWGTVSSQQGAGVMGCAPASGSGVGVHAVCPSETGFALLAEGRLKVDGQTILGTTTGPATFDALDPGSITFRIGSIPAYETVQGGDGTDWFLVIDVKLPDGTHKQTALGLDDPSGYF